MDLKAISWVGNIYQKFEAMCLEVEEVMYQDTVDYVENQVQTVGASVKKFYSEILQDLHPESFIDPVKVAAADFSLNPYAHIEIEKNPRSGLKDHPRGIDMKFTEDTQVIKGKIKHGGLYRRQNVGIRKSAIDNHLPSKATLPVASMSWEKNSKPLVCEMREGCEMTSDNKDVTLHQDSAKRCPSREMGEEIDRNSRSTIESAVPDMTTLVESARPKQEDTGCTSSFGSLSSGLSGTRHADMNKGTNSHTDSTISNGSAERSENNDSYLLEAYDVLELEDEAVDHNPESQLEETCVLVEGDELLVPQDPVKHKSYKKKIREAFSSKMKLTRKEYEKLATLHENQPSTRDTEEKSKMSADSEWELL